MFQAPKTKEVPAKRPKVDVTAPRNPVPDYNNLNDFKVDGTLRYYFFHIDFIFVIARLAQFNCLFFMPAFNVYGYRF